MSVVRVAFMGTPEFAEYHLKQLYADPHYQVVGVVSQPDRKQGRKLKLTPSPVKKLALEHETPVITPDKFNNTEVFDTVASWRPEVIIVVAYGQIISSKFLKMFDQRVVNVHASLLPRWRGAAPIQRSIIEGDIETGVCLQVMKKKLDAGDVIGERKISISDDINAIELHDKLKVLGADLLYVELMDYIRGNLTPVKQDEQYITYAEKLLKSESLIDWKLPAKKIHNLIRGMQLGPGTYSLFQGSKFKIHKTTVVSVESDGPGYVMASEPNELLIGCGENALKILMIQPESRSRMETSEFLKGHPIQKGEIFGE